MSLTKRIRSELARVPPGVPLAVEALAQRLQCTPEEILAASEALQRRQAGDEELITVVKKTSGDGAEQLYVSQLPLTLNDEPESR